MTGILLPCRRCGNQVYSSEVRNGLCLNCRVDESLSDLRAEHARLWRKRERYQSKGANADSVNRQVARIEQRMASRIVEMVPDEKEAAEQLKKTLEKARASRYDVRTLR